MRLTLLALTLSLTAASALAQDVAVALQGRWIGTGTEPDGLTWPMELEIQTDLGLVWYPSFPCAARWSFDLAPGAASLTGTEVLTAGTELCADHLALQIYPGDKGGLVVEWYDIGAVLAGRALLERP